MAGINRDGSTNFTFTQLLRKARILKASGYTEGERHELFNRGLVGVAARPKQLSREEAIALAEGKFWETLSARERAEFQLSQDRLSMPFDVFHQALEDALGRPVYTHELGLNRDGLIAELLGQREAPSLDEIIALIPAEKRLLVQVSPAGD